MDDDKVPGSVVALVALMILVVGMALGAFVWLPLRDYWTKLEAAKAGAGRWVADEKTGHTAWEWTGRQP